MFQSADVFEIYQQYLCNLLMLGQEKYAKAQFHAFQEAQGDKKRELTFYERMKIDEMLRKNKEVEEALKEEDGTKSRGPLSEGTMSRGSKSRGGTRRRKKRKNQESSESSDDLGADDDDDVML